ncbi:MbtH family NRPS accessory protein [Microbispora sp. NPDC088329]|uniref:MbtH family NRPS accessory protein n=1 Tax=Microbispora sp. NPDC088329 TaxID=3154869 RepID=UPI003415353D
MITPFDDEDGTFLVLIHDERQQPLRPQTFGSVPDGWRSSSTPSARRTIPRV